MENNRWKWQRATDLKNMVDGHHRLMFTTNWRATGTCSGQWLASKALMGHEF